MLAEALQAEVDAHIAWFADERDEQGQRPMVRNGYHQPREVLTSASAAPSRWPSPPVSLPATPASGQPRKYGEKSSPMPRF
jgi:hypothetical protein